MLTVRLNFGTYFRVEGAPDPLPACAEDERARSTGAGACPCCPACACEAAPAVLELEDLNAEPPCLPWLL